MAIPVSFSYFISFNWKLSFKEISLRLFELSRIFESFNVNITSCPFSKNDGLKFDIFYIDLIYNFESFLYNNKQKIFF